jgi:uncharacterized membrane protein YdbT with pleckstrin-like domain
MVGVSAPELVSISVMAFPRKFLNDNEEIILERKPHLLFLFAPVLLFLASVAIGALVALKVNPKKISTNDLITYATFIVPVLSVLWFAAKWVRRSSNVFVLTTDRLIRRSGVFSKQSMEIPLQRINNVASSQSFFERMIRVGDLMIESGGEEGQERVQNIPRPFEVQNQIYKQIERNNARTVDGAAGRRELTVPEQIEKLGDLVAKGVLTQAEFDAKKAQLLEKL